jgi:DNA-binding NarL/FixJ family response regulator
VDPYRIVLADDHALFRQGLKNILEKKADLKVVGEAGDGLELLNLLNAGKLAPDLIILDISMPNLRGIEVIPEIKRTHPKMKVLIVTMHKDKEYLYQAFAAGVDGYFLKKDAGAELFNAVEKVRQGKIYLSAHLSESVDNWEQIYQGFRKPLLTTREREVLKLVAEGKSNREIADLLFISIHTVERHRANIMNKLDMKKSADLVRYAMQKGYI